MAIRHIRRIPERLLHQRRRANAVERIRSSVTPGTVLVLCHGNICRSPFAAELFARESRGPLSAAFPVDSAGFIGPNRSSPPPALAAASRVGIDLSSHRSKLFTSEMVLSAGLVVVMSSAQEDGLHSRFGKAVPPTLILGDLDPLPIDARTITDPWNCDDEVFDASYARIDRCVRELVRLLTAQLSQPASHAR